MTIFKFVITHADSSVNLNEQTSKKKKIIEIFYAAALRVDDTKWGEI